MIFFENVAISSRLGFKNYIYIILIQIYLDHIIHVSLWETNIMCGETVTDRHIFY